MSAARYLTIRSLPPPAVCLAALALLAGALPARADPLPLPDGERLSPPWEGMLFLAPDSGVRAERAATFRVTDAPEVGRALVVGPWLAGEWSARAELRTPLPARSTDFTGLYRTVDLLPFTAVVRVEEYGAAGKRVGTVSYPLAPAKEWTEFRVRLDKFPPGTESLRAAFGLAQHTEGQAWFARLEARPAGAHPLAEMEAPRLTRPAPPAPQKGTGFYRVHLSGDTWWLLDPDGRPCWSRATDPPAAPLEPEEYVEQVRGWGFNGLAGWHSLRRYGDGNRAAIAAGQAPMPQFAVLNFHDARRFGQYDMLTDGHGRRKDGEHGFPDPFDPRFVEAAGKLARDRAALVRNAPWFVAWFVDNEIDYSDLYRYVWSRHCGEAFVAFLQRKYPEIKTLNRRWDTKLPDYAALAAKKPVPPLMAGRMYEDFLAFERVLAKRYVDVTVDAARTADANHLVASNRHMLSGLTEWLRHVDSTP